MSRTLGKALITTKRVEIIDKTEFAKTALDENIETYEIYMTSQSLNLMLIYPAKEA